MLHERDLLYNHKRVIVQSWVRDRGGMNVETPRVKVASVIVIRRVWIQSILFVDVEQLD